MADHLACQMEWRSELLNGEVVYMSPRPMINHNRVAFNIACAFRNFLQEKPYEAFMDGADVHLTEKDCVVPDAMIVCDPKIVKEGGIYGTPDLIVEVLSHGTEKKTGGTKKIYTKNAAFGNTGS